MKVSDVMTANPICAEVPGRRDEVLELMKKHVLAGLPVVKRGTRELVGMITRDDLEKDRSEAQVAMLMTRSPITVTPDTELKEAARILYENHFGRLPVVKDDELVGIITVGDIVRRGISKMKIDDPVSKYMLKYIVAVWDETPTPVVFKIMRLCWEKALCVINSDLKIVGLVKDADIFKRMSLETEVRTAELSPSLEGDTWAWDSKNIIYIGEQRMEIPDIPIKEVMVKNPKMVTTGTTVTDCAKKMAKYKVGQFPVIDGVGELRGIVRDFDLLKALI